MKIRRTRRRAGQKGFSLAELMVVIVIIGLLATLVTSNVVRNLFKGQEGKVVSDVQTIVQALETYAIENSGRYPDSLEALIIPDANGFTFLSRDTVPKDPWGTEYQYEPPAPGQIRPRVFSFGADGVPGGEGTDRDIDNFMIQNEEL